MQQVQTTKRLTARVNDYSKVKLHGSLRPLNFISLRMDSLDPLDQHTTDLLFQRNRKISTCHKNCNKLIGDIKIHLRNVLGKDNHKECYKENVIHGRSMGES